MILIFYSSHENVFRDEISHASDIAHLLVLLYLFSIFFKLKKLIIFKFWTPWSPRANNLLSFFLTCNLTYWIYLDMLYVGFGGKKQYLLCCYNKRQIS